MEHRIDFSNYDKQKIGVICCLKEKVSRYTLRASYDVKVIVEINSLRLDTVNIEYNNNNVYESIHFITLLNIICVFKS